MTDLLNDAIAQSLKLENKARALQIRTMKRKADRKDAKRARQHELQDTCQSRQDEFQRFKNHVEFNEAMQRQTLRADQMERERLCRLERDRASSLRVIQKKIRLAELDKDAELDSFTTSTQRERREHEARIEKMLLEHRKRVVLKNDRIERLKADYEFIVKFGVTQPDHFFTV